MTTRESAVELVTEALAEHDGVDHPDDVDIRRDHAQVAVDALVGGALFFPAERYDEVCHSCERPIRDHFVDGRHPGESVLLRAVGVLLTRRLQGKLETTDGLRAWNDVIDAHDEQVPE